MAARPPIAPWRRRTRGGVGLGDPGWFGYSAAILAGDLAFVVGRRAARRLAAAGCDASPGPGEVFTELRTEVIAGQYLDLVLAADGAAGEEAARRVALLKSARYTVTRPLLLGRPWPRR